MKKIGDCDPFFDFFYFFFKTLARHQKKNHNPKSGSNLQAGKFLKYWKKTEHACYQGRREKRQCFNRFSLIFCLMLWKKTKLLNPRSARPAWGLELKHFKVTCLKNLAL
jgi:hypothetical protein